MDPDQIEASEGAPRDNEGSQESTESAELDMEKCQTAQSSDAANQPGSASVPLSKNKQKKLAKQQKVKEAKIAKKAAKKEEKKREREERKSQDESETKRPKREGDQESGDPNKPSRNGQKRAFLARRYRFFLSVILEWLPRAHRIFLFLDL
jgi:hypothetical protein